MVLTWSGKASAEKTGTRGAMLIEEYGTWTMSCVELVKLFGRWGSAEL